MSRSLKFSNWFVEKGFGSAVADITSKAVFCCKTMEHGGREVKAAVAKEMTCARAGRIQVDWQK